MIIEKTNNTTDPQILIAEVKERKSSPLIFVKKIKKLTNFLDQKKVGWKLVLMT